MDVGAGIISFSKKLKTSIRRLLTESFDNVVAPLRLYFSTLKRSGIRQLLQPKCHKGWSTKPCSSWDPESVLPWNVRLSLEKLNILERSMTYSPKTQPLEDLLEKIQMFPTHCRT
ncbi:hypothetical protein KSP40_PGU012847 [Platanthera guangdongensis]|uniref:Uncharacterized protein n=1 Tax=Platanthera guangdongensis TaxID=2320717 RepID=A0ABR2LEZ9_9ASPA